MKRNQIRVVSFDAKPDASEFMPYYAGDGVMIQAMHVDTGEALSYRHRIPEAIATPAVVKIASGALALKAMIHPVVFHP